MSVPTPTRLHWWQWPTVLSLDAPAVVIAWQWLFAAVGGVAIGWPESVVVGTSVWLAYAADRWLETWLVPTENLITPRHRFYARFRRLVGTIWLVALVGDIAVAFTSLSRRELAAGFCLLLPTITYVVSHQFLHRHIRLRLPKEICIALLIAAGSTLFVFAESTDPSGLIAPVALFTALCFTNVALIGVWESEVDRSQGQTSLAHQFPAMSSISRLLPLAVAAIAAIGGSTRIGLPPVPAHCVVTSAVVLALVDRMEPKIGWRAARVLADVALLTPLLPLSRGLWR